MFERGHWWNVTTGYRSGTSIATLALSAVGIVLAVAAWTSAGPLRGARAGPEAPVQAPPKAAPEEFLAPPPPREPSIVRARNAAKQELLDLEDAIARAELVIAVRLVDVYESKIVRGGKQEDVTLQFRFEPVRTLKGIYARDALLLTGQDLGVYRYGAGPERVERGQVFLLLLGRNGPGYFNCNQAGSLELSIPRLSGQDDPLLASVETLIAVTQQRDRSRKTALLIDGLRVAKGRDAVPLLVSLRRRAMLAAQSPGVLEALSRPLRDPSPVMKEAAAQTLAAVLEADYLGQRALRDGATDALIAALDGGSPDIAARVALLDALGSTGKDDRRWTKARTRLGLDRGAPTFAERAAWLRALGKLSPADLRANVVAALEALPLDAPGEVQEAAARALGALDPAESARHLVARLALKYDAGLEIASEIGLIGELPGSAATPALLDVARRALDFQERLALAVACGRVKDPKLVPVLAGLIDPTNVQVRWPALDALMAIDTPEAARAAWPHLAEESDLAHKLRLAGFVGGYGYRGGYPYAIEHISDPNLRELAVEALASIREPRAIPELRAIWQKSNDLAWSAAAIRALGRLGEADIASRLLALAQDLKDPLTAPALIALGDLNEPRALPLVRAGLASRSDVVVIAATRAARKLLSRPGVRADDVRDGLAALLADGHASSPVRDAALQALAALDDPRLTEALGAAVRDAALEGSPLLKSVEERLAARKEPIK
jgi:HEAT repeat protein